MGTCHGAGGLTTLKADAYTTIVEESTLTPDGKSAAYFEVKENGVTVQKAGYVYDAKGQPIYLRRYKDGLTSYIETAYTYNQQGLLTSTTAAGVTVSTAKKHGGTVLTRWDGSIVFIDL